mmetsp:Transcript_84318/g.212606  ORF Transcript_84318/g.212606 Transcript_84318/m.212606 type:complete len:155 (+) Transcript_84318:1803-2267(+)
MRSSVKKDARFKKAALAWPIRKHIEAWSRPLPGAGPWESPPPPLEEEGARSLQLGRIFRSTPMTIAEPTKKMRNQKRPLRFENILKSSKKSYFDGGAQKEARMAPPKNASMKMVKGVRMHMINMTGCTKSVATTTTSRIGRSKKRGSSPENMPV